MTCEDRNEFFLIFGKSDYLFSLLNFKEKFQSKQTVNVFRKYNTVPKATKLYNNHSTFSSPIYTFCLAGNIIVYTPTQGTNREKYSNHIVYEGKKADFGGKETPLRPFLPS